MKHKRSALKPDNIYGMIPRQGMPEEEVDLSHAIEQSVSTPAAFKPI
jgi:hypothetical protein